MSCPWVWLFMNPPAPQVYSNPFCCLPSPSQSVIWIIVTFNQGALIKTRCKWELILAEPGNTSGREGVWQWGPCGVRCCFSISNRRKHRAYFLVEVVTQTQDLARGACLPHLCCYEAPNCHSGVTPSVSLLCLLRMLVLWTGNPLLGGAFFLFWFLLSIWSCFC